MSRPLPGSAGARLSADHRRAEPRLHIVGRGGDSMPGALDKMITVTALLCVQHVSSNISGCVSMSWSVVGDFSSGH